jgi:hypothetical protein
MLVSHSLPFVLCCSTSCNVKVFIVEWYVSEGLGKRRENGAKERELRTWEQSFRISYDDGIIEP